MRGWVAHALAFVLGFGAVFTLLWFAIALVGALAGEMVYPDQPSFQAATTAFLPIGSAMTAVPWPTLPNGT